MSITPSGITPSGSILTGRFESSHAVMSSAAFLQSRDVFGASLAVR